ncbi:MAG: maltodextrin glucosidase [Armatimonadota bacterium]
MKFDYKETIYSDGSAEFISAEKKEVAVKIRVYKKNAVKSIYLCTAPEGERFYIEMKKVKTDSFFQYWQAKIDIVSDNTSYKFLITSENDTFWYSQFGITTYIPPDIYDFKYLTNHHPVKWLKDAVFYQIFPERFCDGDSSNNVKDNEYTYCGKRVKALPWGKTADKYGEKAHMQFNGGDLAGIKRKIPYLKSLGVNALYLTPVFLSPSPHKYDVQDYYNIDPHFGTNKEFSELVKLLHKNNFRIILDGVFNHCGMSHYWFNKSGYYKTKGAYNDKKSPYYEFFKFYKYPGNYKCWLAVKTLPKLNYESEKLKDTVYRGENAIVKYWLKPPYNIDGWRLDVANMTARLDQYQMHHKFWREFLENVKKTKKESFVMGEHFFDAQELLQGHMMDSVMNYQGFYFPVIKWFTQTYDFITTVKKRIYTKTKYTADDLNTAMAVTRAQIPWQIQTQMYNLLSSHDIPRFYSIIKKNKKLLKCGLILLFTHLGIPGIFYGDEIGLEGKNSIDCRRCMIWDKNKQDKDIYNLMKKLIGLRKKEKILQKGGFKALYAGGSVFAYARFIKNKALITVINKGEKQTISLPLWKIGITKGVLKDIFTEKKFKVTNGVLKLKLGKQESLCLKLT